MTEIKHTALPWTITWVHIDNNGPMYFIDQVKHSTTDEEHEENANLLSRACNNYYNLMAELEEARATFFKYYEIHMEKNPPDLVKAEANLRASKKCERALQKAAA